MTSAALDASALMAVLRGEPGSALVRARLPGALMSTVNYAEVLKKTIERGGSPALAEHVVRSASVLLVPFDQDQARATADLYPFTKHLGLSFADRACLALAAGRKAEVLTSERRMGQADIGVEVTLIRGGP